jgi:hypothetical protein
MFLLISGKRWLNAAHTVTMSLLSWLQAKTPNEGRKNGRPRTRKSFGQTTLPLISPRRGRRILRREQLFSVVRESLIRGGVLSTSYDFKVLTLDANGDSFLVLIDLALPADAMPDAYLLEVELWIQSSARARHDMAVPSVYWRRKAEHDQRGIALKAAVAAQTKRQTPIVAEMPAFVDDDSPTAIPAPPRSSPLQRAQAVEADEVEAFRRALEVVAPPLREGVNIDELHLPVPESHSDFSALSETQYGKL